VVSFLQQSIIEAMSRGRRRSTRVEERQHLSGRQNKSGRRATNAVAAAALLAGTLTDHKNRSFDRGAVPTLSFPSTALLSATSLADGGSALASGKASPPLLAPPETSAEDEEEEGGDGVDGAEPAAREPLSRESIKAASRSKLAQRARRDKSERAVHHTALDVEADGFS